VLAADGLAPAAEALIRWADAKKWRSRPVGLMTELFVALPQMAASYGPRNGEGFKRAQFAGLTNLEFETLWAILEDAQWDVKRHALLEIASTESTWTFQFPAPYVAKLRATDQKKIREAAELWSATEEVAASPADVLPVIEALVELARNAAAKGEDLFLWTSL
jgi:hypothetical protein